MSNDTCGKPLICIQEPKGRFLRFAIKSVTTGTVPAVKSEKAVNGAITRYLYEYDKVVLELDGTGNQTGRNVYGTNLLMRSADGTTYYYMYNGHADVTALLKPDGTIAATYYYDAFGNITDTTGAANNSITFAGYQYDKETGLYYLNARMYDPKTARFLQEDTYTGDRNDPLSLNLYTYCHNEPLMYSDPTGHSWASDRWDDAKKWGKKAGNALSDGAEWFADKASDVWDTTKKAVNDNIIKPVVKIGTDIKSAYSTYKKMSPKEKKMLRAVNNKVLSATDPVAAGLDSLMSSWEDFNQEMDQNQKFLNSNRIYTGDPIGNNIGAGIYKSLSKTITNTYDVLTNPFEMYDTAKLLATMSNPNMTQQKFMYQTSIGINAYTKFNEFNDADAFTKIYMGSEAATDVAQIAAPFVPKGLKALRGFEVEEAVSLSGGTNGASKFIRGGYGSMGQEVPYVADFFEGVDNGVLRGLDPPTFYSVPNEAGGNIHISTDFIKQRHFANIIDSTEGNVKLLSGTHGNIDGGFKLEKSFFDMDVARWGGKSNIEILDVAKMSERQLAEVLNSNSTIVCGWCYSERSTAVLKALGLIK